MKKQAKKFTVVFSALMLLITAQSTNAQSYAFAIKGNPIVTHKFTSDPATLVHDGKVYMYTGHDEAPSRYSMNNPQEWLVFSSSDLLTWQEHPVPLKREDFKWTKDGDQAWAAHVTERNGKFYMYVTIGNFMSPSQKIGVAVANNPAGPFKDVTGAPLIAINQSSMDPVVFIDDDGQAYIFWGGVGQCFYAKLKNNMIELDSPTTKIDIDNFAMAPWVHKRDGWYYLSYAQGVPSKIGYAMSKSINGPWEYKGVLNEVPGNTGTNHHAILPDFGGKSYFFYHNAVLPFANSTSRSVCVDYLYYNPDGTMKKIWMTSEGIVD